MRRVVHLLGPSAGGIRRHVRYLASHPPDGWETAVVAGPGALASYFSGLPFVPLSRAGGLFPPKGDLLHAHGLTPGLVALRPRRPPVVVTLHMDVDTQGRTARWRVLRALAPRISARADALIAVSERIGRRFPRAEVIPPASEPPGPARRTRAEVRDELGAGPEDVVVLTVARLHPDKGIDVFMDGVLQAGAVGWVAGEGPLRAELERSAAGGPVRILGYREDVADLLGAADVFALPATGEGYGIAVAEALAAGLPVVATRAGAMPELVGDAGILVEPGDRTGFARALERMVGDPEERGRAATRARARELPAPGELVRRVGAVYDRVTEGR